jgi:Fe-S oxidoreductase
MLSHLTFDGLAVSCGTCREALQHMGAADIFGCSLVDVGGFAMAHSALSVGKERLLYHRPCHDSLDDRAPALLRKSGAQVHSVPHCCSEAGTLALSRPDISHKMLTRKREALAQLTDTNKPTPLVTNCPSCLSGLGRQDHPGIEPVHLAVLLARENGGEDWQEVLAKALQHAEVITF